MSQDKGYRIFAILVALAGLLILWQSTVWGLQAVPGIIEKVKTISGDIQHQVVYEGSVVTLQIIGGVLFATGLYRVLEPTKKF